MTGQNSIYTMLDLERKMKFSVKNFNNYMYNVWICFEGALVILLDGLM